MDDVDSQQIKPRTLADSTNSSQYGKDSVLNSHDSYDSNSVLSTGAFTNDPNYSSTEVNIDNFKI